MQPALAPSSHMLRNPQDPNNSPEQAAALRDQLLSHVLKNEIPQQNPGASPGHGTRTHAGVNPGPHHGHSSSAGSASGGTHVQNIDPAIAGSGMMSHSPGESAGDDGGAEARKAAGKRELSTSKRAAQNRAAQRAFRQRKEGHIKQLEEQVRDYAILNENFKRIQAENYQLRDYIISLQSRLIESQGEFPQPPTNIDLHQPREISTAAAGGAALVAGGAPSGSGGSTSNAPTAPMGGGARGAGGAADANNAAAAAAAAAAASQLQANAAQAVVDGNTDPALMGRK